MANLHKVCAELEVRNTHQSHIEKRAETTAENELLHGKINLCLTVYVGLRSLFLSLGVSLIAI